MESIVGRVIATILSVLALAGVGYLGFQAFSSSRVSNFVVQVANVQETVLQTYSSSPSFSGLSGMLAKNLPQLQSMWASTPTTATVATAGTYIDPWSNSVTLYGGTDSGSKLSSGTLSAGQFVIEDSGTNLTVADCQALINAIAPSAYAIYYNGSSTAVTKAGQMATPTAVATACGGSPGQAIDFVFSH